MVKLELAVYVEDGLQRDSTTEQPLATPVELSSGDQHHQQHQH